MMRYIGSHLSTAGGIHRAFDDMRELSINTFQIFLKSNNRWQDKPYKREDLDLFREEWDNHPEVRIFAHTGYLINPAADDAQNRTRSLNALVDELTRAEKLGIQWVVLHPGSHKGTGPNNGIVRAAELIDAAFEKANSTSGILLETTAGQGNAIGCSFEDIALIIEELKNPERVGVCLDTCHVFAAGYDFTTPAGMNMMMNEFDRIIGLEKLKLIHLNDSKHEAGTNKDRHEHLGKGMIGENGFRLLLNDRRLKDIPVILETPKAGNDRLSSDRENLQTIFTYIGK
jgi:deoxyribonuclease IV